MLTADLPSGRLLSESVMQMWKPREIEERHQKGRACLMPGWQIV